MRLTGAWAVADDEGRTELFLSPDLLAVAKGSAISGLVSGLIGGDGTPDFYSPNRGEGVQTVKRAKTPMRGIPVRWTPVATVSRQRSESGAAEAYSVEAHESSLPAVRFLQQVGAESLAGYVNGFGDPRYGVYDLVHDDGRIVVRHWATIDEHRRLVGSVFDVEDEAFPLREAVILCLARVYSWQT